MIIERKDVCFFYYDNMGIINDYYQMIVDIIKKIIDNNEVSNLNITLCNSDYNFKNNQKTIKISINYEHTLVKIGGRSVSQNTPIGNIYDDNGNKYLVRIDRFNELNGSDIVIDYSIPNIYNVKNSNFFNDFSKKHIYISPTIYNLNLIKENRNITTLTTFINTKEERRANLINRINDARISHININNCFEKNDIQKLYNNTKIIINVHQTEHHHTFEELRALPALECGIIIISEISPLSNLIPYSDFIIWVGYNDIIEKTKEIINNYDYYHDLIFSKDKVNQLLELKNKNYCNLQEKILSI
jgi:hypothetical protein